MSQRFFPFAIFGGLLAMAGLPIYIHAPKFYVDEYGVSLAALGAVLFGLRLLDVVQDPLFGRLSEVLRSRRGLAVWIGSAVMALSDAVSACGPGYGDLQTPATAEAELAAVLKTRA